MFADIESDISVDAQMTEESCTKPLVEHHFVRDIEPMLVAQHFTASQPMFTTRGGRFKNWCDPPPPALCQR